MIHFIINPAAGNGKASGLWKAYENELSTVLKDIKTHFSEKTGDARTIAKQLVESGARQVVAVGGDGTNNEVINGLYDALGADDLTEVTYALLPLGSGNDWIKTHKIPRRLTDWIKMYQAGKTSTQNLGLIDYVNFDGKPEQRVFANVAGMAYDAYVVKRMERLSYKNPLLYPLLTLAYLGAFSPPKLELKYDADETVRQRFHTINVGVCRYNGGGMRLVPQADPQGDDFALTYAKKLSIFRILASSWRFYTDTVGQIKGAVTTHAKSVTVDAVETPEDLLIEADGELLGTGPLRFTLLPAKLKFIKP